MMAGNAATAVFARTGGNQRWFLGACFFGGFGDVSGYRKLIVLCCLLYDWLGLMCFQLFCGVSVT